MADVALHAYADPHGLGDVLQATTKAAFWRQMLPNHACVHRRLPSTGRSPPWPRMTGLVDTSIRTRHRPAPTAGPRVRLAPSAAACRMTGATPGTRPWSAANCTTRCASRSIRSAATCSTCRSGAARTKTCSGCAAHNMRWLRVLATGHGLGLDRAPRDAASAIAALQALLQRVEAFNAAHESSQSIYVLVGLTDYYPPGVPGDGHAYDHPTFKDVPVLPAPWYRAGIPFLRFRPGARLRSARTVCRTTSSSTNPGCRRSFRHWPSARRCSAGSSATSSRRAVARATASAASRRTAGTSRSRATSSIRSATRDRHHLIFTGTQYVAELTDYEYRPRADLAPDLVPGYRQIHQRLLDACGQWCWNVLGLTYYDFNPYTLDDALARPPGTRGGALTEYGFTNRPTDTAEDRRGRYGGDRAAAVRDGWAHAWKGLDGSVQTSFPGAADLVTGGTVVGVAPWASPSPQGGPGSRRRSRCPARRDRCARRRGRLGCLERDGCSTRSGESCRRSFAGLSGSYTAREHGLGGAGDAPCRRSRIARAWRPVSSRRATPRARAPSTSSFTTPPRAPTLASTRASSSCCP